MDKKQTKLEIMRHSTSHLMATAILSLHPQVKFGVGPTIANGFYYDLDLKENLTPLDLLKIEKRMRQLVKQHIIFKKNVLSIEQAMLLFKKLKQPYKIKLLQAIKKEGTTRINPAKEKSKKNSSIIKNKPNQVTIYQTGDFIDLCRGPHVESIKEIGVFKLTKIAGAYWRGNEKNKMLQRIYGIAFNTQAELDEYLKQQKEAEQRDHVKLGRELDLFSINPDFGQGLPLWHPNGAILRQIMENFILTEYQKRGYQLVRTPHLANINIFRTSGHLGFYREHMYAPIKVENEEYIIKPMNCPGHIKIYQTHLHSYRDLPIRYTELGTVYRYEKSGTLHGLVRVRGFTQDDAHIFCTPQQLHHELVEVIKLTKFILQSFGFQKKNFEVVLSLRDPANKKKYLGNDEIWQLAETALAKALKSQGWSYQEEIGEAAFYGPKIDILVKDALGRQWQISTLQVDFNLSERFDITYIDNQGKKQRPIMLHRALLGSLERFTGLLIEHYAGAFPLWLSPVQIYLAAVGEKHHRFTQQLAQEFIDNGFRCQINNLNETISHKVRDAEKQKIPYILVIGDKEMNGRYLNIRQRREKKTTKLTKKQFIDKMKEQIAKKK